MYTWVLFGCLCNSVNRLTGDCSGLYQQDDMMVLTRKREMCEAENTWPLEKGVLCPAALPSEKCVGAIWLSCLVRSSPCIDVCTKCALKLFCNSHCLSLGLDTECSELLLTMDDFVQAATKLQPSVSEPELLRYKLIRQRFTA